MARCEPPRIILASGSPRRRELLAALIPEFDVIVSDIPEPTTGDAVADAIELARQKAGAIATMHGQPGTIVIGSDTIVFDASRSYGKPSDAADAIAMLEALAGREHRVVTGIAVVGPQVTVTGASISLVSLSPLTVGQIAEYVASERPLDKAGAYAIQDEDVPTVANLDGCYCGVMGLPLWKLRSLLEAAGVRCADPSATYGRCMECPERVSLGDG